MDKQRLAALLQTSPAHVSGKTHAGLGEHAFQSALGEAQGGGGARRVHARIGETPFHKAFRGGQTAGGHSVRRRVRALAKRHAEQTAEDAGGGFHRRVVDELGAVSPASAREPTVAVSAYPS